MILCDFLNFLGGVMTNRDIQIATCMKFQCTLLRLGFLELKNMFEFQISLRKVLLT